MAAVNVEHVERLAMELTPTDQLRLMEELARRLRRLSSAPAAPRDLYGDWKGKFPDDMDLDAVLAGSGRGGRGS